MGSHSRADSASDPAALCPYHSTPTDNCPTLPSARFHLKKARHSSGR